MLDERQYVIEIIEAFLAGSAGVREWTNFVSSSLRDAELDRIRRAAAAVEVPLNSEGRAILQALLVQADLTGSDDPAAVRPWRVETGMGLGLLIGAALWWLNRLPGAALFADLHLLLLPAAAGLVIVNLRNSRRQVGVHDPRIVRQNRRGRV